MPRFAHHRQDKHQSQSRSPNKTQVRHALVPKSTTGNFKPCFPPTCLHERGKRASPEKSVYLQPGKHLRFYSRNLWTSTLRFCCERLQFLPHRIAPRSSINAIDDLEEGIHTTFKSSEISVTAPGKRSGWKGGRIGSARHSSGKSCR